jgi:death on curing protein
MRYLTLGEVVNLYRKIVQRTGGAVGIRDLGALESALAQPRATFGATDLHVTPIDKAAALGFSLIGNHPFLDGNKRLGHAAMETFLVLNGYEARTLSVQRTTRTAASRRSKKTCGLHVQAGVY